MTVYFHTHFLQTGLEHLCTVLTGIMGNADTSHIQVLGFKDRFQTKQIGIIGNPKITAYFIFLNILCADNDHDFHLICQLHQHPQFAVRLKSRKYAGCMIIIIQLSAKFQIQFVVKLLDPLSDML